MNSLRNSGIDLVFALEYAFFQLCSSAKQISVRLPRFRRSYVKCTAVILTSHTSYKVFLLDVCCVVQSGQITFCSCLSPMIVYLHNLFLNTLFATFFPFFEPLYGLQWTKQILYSTWIDLLFIRCCLLISLTENHMMDLLYLLKENFRHLVFNLLITGRASRICLIYQVVFYHKDEDSVEYIWTYYEALDQTLLTQYILWSGSLWYAVRSSMLKNKRIFSLVILKLTPAFTTVQLDVARDHFN